VGLLLASDRVVRAFRLLADVAVLSCVACMSRELGMPRRRSCMSTACSSVVGACVGGAGLLGARLGGDCFQRLTVITCPKANKVLWRRRFWAPVPSRSSKETERENVAPGE
jgi:hypothetical protein